MGKLACWKISFGRALSGPVGPHIQLGRVGLLLWAGSVCRGPADLMGVACESPGHGKDHTPLLILPSPLSFDANCVTEFTSLHVLREEQSWPAEAQLSADHTDLSGRLIPSPHLPAP